MPPLDPRQVVGMGYDEREGLPEMSRRQHDCVLVLFNVSRSLKEENRSALSLQAFSTTVRYFEPAVHLNIRVPTVICLPHAVSYQCTFSIYIYIQGFPLVSVTTDANDARKRNLKVLLTMKGGPQNLEPKGKSNSDHYIPVVS